MTGPGSDREERERHREEQLIRSAVRARKFSPEETLLMGLGLNEAARRLHDAAREALARRRR
ncbi:MAG: hypothetical protein AABY30_06680 [Candidatus Thermoplasmatota archaeon]